MMQTKAAFIMQIIGFIASLVGTVCFYIGFPNITLICGAITIVDSYFQVIGGGQNGFITEIFTIVVGLVIAVIFDVPIIACIAVALCIGSLAMTIIGWILFLFFLIKR